MFLKHCHPGPAPESTMYPFYLQPGSPLIQIPPSAPPQGMLSTLFPPYWLPSHGLSLIMLCLSLQLAKFHNASRCSSILSILPTSMIASAYLPSPPQLSHNPWRIQSTTSTLCDTTKQLPPTVLVGPDSFGHHMLELYQGFSSSTLLTDGMGNRGG